MKRFVVGLAVLALSASCSFGGGARQTGGASQEEQPTVSSEGAPTPGATASPVISGVSAALPIYVTVAVHIEDVPAYANCDAYPDFRDKLLQFAQAVAPTGAAVNLQIEYEFLMGVSRCETPAMQVATDGQNVLDYLATRYGYEIDAHQEGGWDIEGQDNYADIRYLGGQVTAAMSENAGGLVWDDPAQWACLAEGETGQVHPEFTWTPQVLTLAVSSRHHLGDFDADDIASGVWLPKGAGQEDFWTHDPGGPIVYVGPGEYDNWSGNAAHLSTPEFVRYLLGQLELAAIPSDRMYTATVAVPQAIVFHPEEYGDLLAVLEELAPLVEAGQVVYVTYSQVVETWREGYGASPNIFFRGE